MVRLVRNSLVLVLFGLAFCWAGVALTSDYDTKNCNVLVHVSEDNESLFLEKIHIPGTYMTTSCWGTSATYCHVLDTSSYYKNEMKNIGTKTFTNRSGQLCYFRNFGLRTGNMGGFYYQPWSYVYDVAVSVDCEDSSSVPLYCAKSERMAKQVLLAREEFKCGEKGGAFEGGVFPVKREGGATEYCVSASCDICGSKWYEDYINDWKTERCCENRKKEPNRNMGTCTNPSPMDSTRIGVKTSEVKAFPGCSDIDAGGRENGNFCSVPGSSSSSESSSSALSSSSEEISSSSEESSSSSEEQETADCYVDEDVADAMLTSREDECWSRQLLPNFKLDHFGCIVGDCEENGSSSSAGDENTGDDLQSSSSEEDGQCRDPSLMKERSNGLDDGWIYVGKEKYSSKIVSYEEAKPAKSGFFDVLGRMYKRVKSKIKYYVGKETKVKKTVEVDEELDVWKKVEVVDGREVVSYVKESLDGMIRIDSKVTGEKSFSTEINLRNDFLKNVDSLGVERSFYYDQNLNLKAYFVVGLSQGDREHLLSKSKNRILKVVDDTVFFDPFVVDVFRERNDSEENVFESEDFLVGLTKKRSVSLMGLGMHSCPEIVGDDSNAACFRFTSGHAKSNYNQLGDGYLYPGQEGSFTYGKTDFRYVNPAATRKYTPGVYCKKMPDCRYKIDLPKFGMAGYSIQVFASNWKRNEIDKKWEELCWSDADMKKTYKHELKHFDNGMHATAYFAQMIFKGLEKENDFPGEDACAREEKKLLEKYKSQMIEWNESEMRHENTTILENGIIAVDASPIPTDEIEKRNPVSCE